MPSQSQVRLRSPVAVRATFLEVLALGMRLRLIDRRTRARRLVPRCELLFGSSLAIGCRQPSLIARARVGVRQPILPQGRRGRVAGALWVVRTHSGCRTARTASGPAGAFYGLCVRGLWCPSEDATSQRVRETVGASVRESGRLREGYEEMSKIATGAHARQD